MLWAALPPPTSPFCSSLPLKGRAGLQLLLPNHRFLSGYLDLPWTETHIVLILTEVSLGQVDRLAMSHRCVRERPGQDCECWLPYILCAWCLSGLTLTPAIERHHSSMESGAQNSGKPGLISGHSTHTGHLSATLTCSFEPQDLCTAISTA